MKLEELAELMGKSKQELIEELKCNDVIELKLRERKNGMIRDNFNIEILD